MKVVGSNPIRVAKEIGSIPIRWCIHVKPTCEKVMTSHSLLAQFPLGLIVLMGARLFCKQIVGVRIPIGPPCHRPVTDMLHMWYTACALVIGLKLITLARFA